MSARKVLETVPEQLKNSFSKTLTKVCEAHILVPREYDELKYLEKIRRQIFDGPHVRVLVLHMTDYCNLHCRYCFIEGNISESYKRQNMTKEIMKKSLDLFGKIIQDKSFPKPPSIVFYGGEPFINWPVLEEGLKYLKEKQKANSFPRNIEKIIITNGTLITPRIAGVLKENRVMVSVSIDGPEKIHNINRIFKNGGGSFKETLKGFKILKDAGIQPTVSCVLSKEGIKQSPRIIRWLVESLGIKALGFNHVSIVPKINVYDPIYESKFADALLRVQEIIQKSYPEVYERRMNHKINSFLARKILRADCTGCGEQMSVSPDGMVGICQGYMGNRKTFGGNVFDQDCDPNQDPIFLEWSNRSPLNMPQCLDCPALATCGGGCPRNADFTNGSIWKVDSAFCHFAKKAQEWMIWKNHEVNYSK